MTDKCLYKQKNKIDYSQMIEIIKKNLKNANLNYVKIKLEKLVA